MNKTTIQNTKLRYKQLKTKNLIKIDAYSGILDQNVSLEIITGMN